MDRIDLRIFAKDLRADPATILDIVRGVIQAYQTMYGGRPFVLDNRCPEAIRLFWHGPEQIGPLTYSPLTIVISVAKTVERFPLLSFIWGLPVLSLPALIREYQWLSSDIEEYGTRKLLKSTVSALTEILTNFEDTNLPDPNLAALQQGRAHHMMLSSSERANGPAPDYPPSYYPAESFQITLTSNKVEMRVLLSGGPAGQSKPLLDILVINQGHGGVARFAGWTAAELRANVVEPSSIPA